MNSRNLLIGLFAVTVVAQLLAPGWMLARHENVVQNGETFRFQCEPVDPLDVLRGRYVALGFRDNTAIGDPGLVADDEGYATLVVGDDGFARFDRFEKERPVSGPYLKATIGAAWQRAEEDTVPEAVVVDLPFDRFYMDETIAQEAQQALRQRNDGAQPAYLEVRILDGYAVPVELYIDDTPAAEFIRNRK